MEENEQIFVKQRKPHSKSFENLATTTANDVLHSSESGRLLFEHERKFVDKQQQTAPNSTLTAENIAWFLVSLISIYVSDIFNVLVNDHRINRSI